MVPLLKRQKKRTDSANIWQSMLTHNQAFTSQAAAPGTFITQVPLSHFLFTDKGNGLEIPGKGAVYYGLPNVHLLGCVYKSRKKKKETSFNWKIINQPTVYKAYHLICGVFCFPFLFIFLGGGGCFFVCLYDIAALMSNNKGLFSQWLIKCICPKAHSHANAEILTWPNYITKHLSCHHKWFLRTHSHTHSISRSAPVKQKLRNHQYKYFRRMITIVHFFTFA